MFVETEEDADRTMAAVAFLERLITGKGFSSVSKRSDMGKSIIRRYFPVLLSPFYFLSSFFEISISTSLILFLFFSFSKPPKKAGKKRFGARWCTAVG